jgi:4-hydroxy-3-polyprenylbenzoate decarboxylase
MTETPSRIILAITGASGVIYGIRMLEILAEKPAIETHLIISPPGETTITQETAYSPVQVRELADLNYDPKDIGASLASGSYPIEGMIIAPCSIKTLAAVSFSYNHNLIVRAADVQLKEGRPLILMVRETPLHPGHLKRMLAAAENGAVIMPPLPSFYSKPGTIEELVDQTAQRVLRRFGIDLPGSYQWQGTRDS